MRKIFKTVPAFLVAAALTTTVAPADLVAQQAPAKAGIMIMAHGGDPVWDAAVVEAVTPLKSRIPTALAMGMADPTTMQAALDSLQAQGVEHVAVVRLFLSGESFIHDTEYYLRLRDDAPAMPMALMMAHGAGGGHGAPAAADPHAGHGAPAAAAADPHAGHGATASADAPAIEIKPLDFTAQILLEMRGISDFPITGQIMADRVAAVSNDPARESVIVVAHGMGDEGENQRVIDNMQASVELLRARGFKEVWATTLREDWPEARVIAEAEIREWVRSRGARGDRVIVAPFRLFGFGGYAEFLGELPYVPTEGLLPHPLISTWIEQSAGELFCGKGIANPFQSCSTASR